MIRSIELMLGLEAMNKFDAVADPMVACFDDVLDPTPYQSVPNNVPLDERHKPGRKLTESDRYWREKTESLDWDHIDAPDPYWLNRIVWYSLFDGSREYPGRPGERSGMREDDDDDDERPKGG
jgi:hypothetical protein